MRAVDADEHDEVPDLRRERRLHADRRDLIDASGERQVRIRVEADAHRLADPQLVDVGLIHPRAHPHRRRIHDVDDGHAGANLVAFLDFRHVAPFFQVVLMTAMPSIGDLISMRSAFDAACLHRCSGRGRGGSPGP